MNRPRSVFAAAQAGSDQRQGAVLPGIEVRLQVEAGDALLGVGDLLSLEVQPALRRREAASQVEASVEATEELRPKLAETVQGDVQAALQALVERPAALNLVIPQAQVEVAQRPALPRLGARLENSAKLAQAALTSNPAQRQPLVANTSLATQGTGQ